MNKIIKEFDWEEELSVLAEKYCNHNDIDEFNNCLYYIFRPLILKALKEQKKEIIKTTKDILFEKYLEYDDTERAIEDILKAIKELKLKDKMSVKK